MLALLYHKLDYTINEVDERKGYKSLLSNDVIDWTNSYPFKVPLKVPLQVPLEIPYERSQQIKDALTFLKKGNLHQRLRKEIQYSLMPTTLQGSS